MVRGCQTCLRVMKDPSSEGLDLNSVSSGSDTIPLEEKLADCVPELILDSVQNAVLCHSCVESLTLAYQFKQRCLEAQQKIYGFLQQVPDSTQTDIGKIAAYYQRLEIIEQGGDPSVDDPSNMNVKCAEMPYSCKWCPFYCLDKCVMRQHRILHRNKAPPYKCDQCYFIFPTAVLLLDHLASHSNERPYACTLCDFESASHKKFKEHGWVHRKAFQCNICWKRFTQRNELDAHVEAHNCELETRLFQCGLCEFKCDALQTISSHSVNNHQNTYNCKTCTVKCRTQLGLMQHMTRAHKDPAEAPQVIDVYEDINCHLNDDVIIVSDDDDETKRTMGGSEQSEGTNKMFFVCANCSLDCKSLDNFKTHFKNCDLQYYQNQKFRTNLFGENKNRSSVLYDTNENQNSLLESINRTDSASDAHRTTSGPDVSNLRANANMNRQHEGMNRVDNASDARESISRSPSDDLINLQEESAANVNNQTIIEVITDTNVQAQTSVDIETGRELGIPPHTEGVSSVKRKRKRKHSSRVRISTGNGSFIRMRTEVAIAMGLFPTQKDPESGSIHPTDAPNQEYSCAFGPNMSVQQSTSNVEQEAMDSNVLPLTIVSENNDVNTEVTNVAKNMDIKTTNLLPNIKANENLDLNVQNTSEIPQNTERKGSDGISKRFPCEHCPIICISERSMRNHLRRAHKVVMARLRTPSDGHIAQKASIANPQVVTDIQAKNLSHLKISGRSDSMDIECGSLDTKKCPSHVEKFEVTDNGQVAKVPQNLSSNVHTTSELKNIFINRVSLGNNPNPNAVGFNKKQKLEDIKTNAKLNINFPAIVLENEERRDLRNNTQVGNKKGETLDSDAVQKTNIDEDTPIVPHYMSVQQSTSNVEQEALESNVLPLTIVSENNDVNTEVTNVAKNMDIKTTNLLPNIKANQNLDVNVQNTSEIPQNTERKGSDGISKRFPCEHCPIICISQRSMSNHLRRAHKDVMARLRTPSDGHIAQKASIANPQVVTDIQAKNLSHLKISGRSDSMDIECGSLDTKKCASHVERFEVTDNGQGAKVPQNLSSNVHTTSELKNIFINRVSLGNNPNPNALGFNKKQKLEDIKTNAKLNINFPAIVLENEERRDLRNNTQVGNEKGETLESDALQKTNIDEDTPIVPHYMSVQQSTSNVEQEALESNVLPLTIVSENNDVNTEVTNVAKNMDIKTTNLLPNIKANQNLDLNVQNTSEIPQNTERKGSDGISKRFPCEHCPIICISQRSMSNHLRRAHKDVMARLRTPSDGHIAQKASIANPQVVTDIQAKNLSHLKISGRSDSMDIECGSLDTKKCPSHVEKFEVTDNGQVAKVPQNLSSNVHTTSELKNIFINRVSLGNNPNPNAVGFNKKQKLEDIKTNAKLNINFPAIVLENEERRDLRNDTQVGNEKGETLDSDALQKTNIDEDTPIVPHYKDYDVDEHHKLNIAEKKLDSNVENNVDLNKPPGTNTTNQTSHPVGLVSNNQSITVPQSVAAQNLIDVKNGYQCAWCSAKPKTFGNLCLHVNTEHGKCIQQWKFWLYHKFFKQSEDYKNEHKCKLCPTECGSQNANKKSF